MAVLFWKSLIFFLSKRKTTLIISNCSNKNIVEYIIEEEGNTTIHYDLKKGKVNTHNIQVYGEWGVGLKWKFSNNTSNSFSGYYIETGYIMNIFISNNNYSCKYGDYF